jgi:hypothetical protein
MSENQSRYRNPDRSDYREDGCAIVGCDKPVFRLQWITIRGRERCKAFCETHYISEYDAELEYKLGL